MSENLIEKINDLSASIGAVKQLLTTYPRFDFEGVYLRFDNGKLGLSIHAGDNADERERMVQFAKDNRQAEWKRNLTYDRTAWSWDGVLCGVKICLYAIEAITPLPQDGSLVFPEDKQQIAVMAENSVECAKEEHAAVTLVKNDPNVSDAFKAAL